MKNSVRFQYYIFSTVSLLVNPFWLLRKEEKTDKIPSSSVLYCILKVCTESRINRAATLRFVASIGVVLGAKKSPEALKPADGRSEFWLRALQYNMEHVILLPIPQTHDSTYGLRRLRTVFTISPLCFLRSHRAAIWEYEIRKEEQGRTNQSCAHKSVIALYCLCGIQFKCNNLVVKAGIFPKVQWTWTKIWSIGRVGVDVLLKDGCWLKMEGGDDEEQGHILSTFLCQVLIISVVLFHPHGHCVFVFIYGRGTEAQWTWCVNRASENGDSNADQVDSTSVRSRRTDWEGRKNGG